MELTSKARDDIKSDSETASETSMEKNSVMLKQMDDQSCPEHIMNNSLSSMLSVFNAFSLQILVQ